jgi:cell division septal protein FtsQ
MADAVGMRGSGARAAYARPERAVKPGSRGAAALRLLLGVALAAVSLYLGYKYALAPGIRAEDVRIAAPSMIDASAARERAVAALGGRPLLFADLSAVEEACEGDPRVLRAEARKVFPSSLSIVLSPRVPVAVALTEGEGRSVPALVDEEGVVFMRDPAAAASDLPVISGMRFEGAVEGSRLPGALIPLLKGLAGSKSALLGALSEIRVVAKPTGEIELLLYLVDAAVPVRTEVALDDETLKSAILVLDVLRRRGGTDDVSEVDLRAGAMIYKSKEDPS